jgi:hypothetical protein
MTTSTLRHSDVIVAGRQRAALLVNVDRGTITRKVANSSSYDQLV